MSEQTFEQFFAHHRNDILAASSTQLSEMDYMSRMAFSRDMSVSEMVWLILGFCVDAISTDLCLGSTVAFSDGLQWLHRLREGHGLDFDDVQVLILVDVLSTHIVELLEPGPLYDQYIHYRDHIRTFTVEQFPKAVIT